MRQLLAVGRPNNPTNNSFQCKHQACKCDTRTIHDHAPTKYTTIQDVGICIKTTDSVQIRNIKDQSKR